LYHLIRMQKRRAARAIRSVRNGNGLIQTSPRSIALAFTTHLRTKYDNIDVDDECARALAELVRVERPMVCADIKKKPFDSCNLVGEIEHPDEMA
jgi:hypothetical protein